APAGPLADVGEPQRPLGEPLVLGEIAEERSLLRAGNMYGSRFESRLEARDLGPAKLAVHLERFLQAEHLRQPRTVDIHRALAVADQKLRLRPAHSLCS